MAVTKQLALQRRSTRVRRLKRNVDDDATKSVPPRSIVSSDDDTGSVKDSSKVFNSVSDLNMMTDSSRLTSRIDTSDTDSRASSLCTHSTRSGTLARASATKLNSRGGTFAKQKARKRSRVFECVADELSKLQSSDSETDSQAVALRTPFFDSFPDNSSNGSSICSSVPAPELSADLRVDNCKNGVGSSTRANESSVVMPDPDEMDLNKSADFDETEKNWLGSEINAKSPQSAFKETVSTEVPEMQSGLENKVTCVQKENSDVDESEDSVSNKGQGLGENSSTWPLAGDNVIETKQEAKDISLTANHDNLETAKEFKKVDNEPRVADQTDDDEEKAGSCSKAVTCGGSEEKNTHEKFDEEFDDMSGVKEEPPEILVSTGIDKWGVPS